MLYLFRWIKRSRTKDEFEKRQRLMSMDHLEGVGISKTDASLLATYYRKNWATGPWKDTWPDYLRTEIDRRTNMQAESLFQVDKNSSGIRTYLVYTTMYRVSHIISEVDAYIERE